MPAKRILTAALSLLLLAGVLAVPADTSAQNFNSEPTHLYWGSYDTSPNQVSNFSRAALDGTGAAPLITTDGDWGGLSVFGDYVYWAVGNSIGRSNFAGSTINTDFVITGFNNTWDVLVAGGYIYWTTNYNPGQDRIGRANLDGTNVISTYISLPAGGGGGSGGGDLSSDGTYLYWVNWSTSHIGRSKLDGTEVNHSFISLSDYSMGLTVSDSYVYWTNAGSGTISRVGLDGTTGRIDAFINTGAGSEPQGIVVSNTHIYWVDNTSHAIGRANLDGSSANPTWIAGSVAKANWGISFGTTYEVPANTVAPTVSGTAKVDATLTAATGTWSGAPTPTYTYQWFRCTGTGAASDTLPAGCTTISGATRATYAIDDPDYQKYLRVRVTGTNGAGNDVSYSAATAKVAASITENRSAPTISGSTTINATLTGNKGSWAGYPAPTYTYQWLRCTRAGSASDGLPSGCTTISGATRTTYKLTTTDYGKYLRLKVVGTNSLGSDTKYSAATAKIAGIDPVNTVAPRITGTASVGSTVTGTEGTWTGFPDPTSTYQWFRCTSAGSASTAQPSNCTAISGATRSTYKLVAADKTSGYLRVRVTGTSAEGRAVRFSAAVKVQ
jgi:hypothetical protein